MATRPRRKNRHRLASVAEIELMPMINVFMAIIPLLLLSAAFVQVAVIPTALPTGTIAAAARAAETPLDLTVVIRADAYVVAGNGIPTRTIARIPAGSTADVSASAARVQLNAVLAAIAAAHPGHRELRIVAESATRYEEIVDVMDVARAAGLPEAALVDAGGRAS